MFGDTGAARVVNLTDGSSHLIGTLPLTVGRDPVSDIRLDEEDVSRRHAYLLRTPQGFLLVDSSRHGTWVNGERIQAQRLLADRDLIQMGSRSFRFEVYGQALPELDLGQPPGDLPATSEYSPTAAGARPTGKMALALALAPRAPWRTRLVSWIKRYGVSEVAGLTTAVASSWLVGTATDNAVVAAYAASFGEGVGFYGSLVLREMLEEAYAAGARRAPYGLAQMARTWRGLFLEFGPSELLDSTLLRPLAMGIGTPGLRLGLGHPGRQDHGRPAVLRTSHMDSRTKAARRVGTVGYQASTVESFLTALREAGIELVVDIRAVASSRRPGFSKSRLAANLSEAGIGYLHLRGLGTPAEGRAAARAGRFGELKRIYHEHLTTLEAKSELAELTELVRSGQRVCLLCFEHDPAHCHRSMVAEALGEQLPIHIDHLSPTP